jgi:hypothetical protein
MRWPARTILAVSVAAIVIVLVVAVVWVFFLPVYSD